MARCNFTIRTTLALAAFLGTALPLLAQHHGGGGPHPGGNFHGGSFHDGGFHDGVHDGFYHRGYYPYWGYPGFVGIDIGLGYGYGYGPYCPAVYPVPVPVAVPVVPATPVPSAPQPVAPAPGAPPARPEPLPPPVPTENLAHIHVIVPAGASLWFNGALTTQLGAERDFTSPSLTPGTAFTYEIKARWMQDGRPVEQTREVEVRAGQTTTVDFNAPAPRG
jgi:uncharacterized protein (TIGR03000 family)